jgi:Transglycosylase-like domain
MTLPAAALAADSGSPSIGVSAAKPIRIGTIAPPVARFQRTIRVVSRRMRAERRAELRRQRRRLFASLPAGVSQATLDAIGACESGGDPAAVSADGSYRGKYQFDYGTWESVGGSGDPAAAPEAEQDYRAALLYAQAGSSPWPICG